MGRQLAPNKWQANVIVDGRRVRPTFNTEAEMLDFERKALSPSLSAKHTVAEVFREGCLAMWHTKKNVKQSVATTEQLIALLGPSRSVATLTTQTVFDLVSDLRKAGNGNATINRKLAALSKLLKRAKKRGLITALPEIEYEEEGGGRERFLTPDEVEDIFAHLSPKFRAFATFLLFTGARCGEAQAIQWRDLQPDRVTFRWSTTKGKKTRTIPLVGGAVKAVNYGRLKGWQSPWEGIEYNSFHTAWTTAKTAAGLGSDPEVVPHTLRHTCASWMVQRGVDLRRVQAWLGHASIKTTERYAHLAPNDLFAVSHVLVSGVDVPGSALYPPRQSAGNAASGPEGATLTKPDLSQSIQRLNTVGECPERQRGRTVNPALD